MTYVGTFPVGPDPMYITCPHCRERIFTRVDVRPTPRTHLIFLLLCLFTLPCLLCCYASCVYCFEEFQGKIHYCPRCRQYIGMYDELN